MIDKTCSYASSLQRVHHGGPVKDGINGFSRHLAEQGYAPWTTKEKIRVVSRFSGWLQENGRAVEDVDERVVSEFLRYRRRRGLSVHGAPPALRDLLAYLRYAGIVPHARVERGPLDAIEGCFSRFLAEERGLSTRTVIHYLPTIRAFLSERFGTGPIALDELTAKDIPGFILRHVKRVSPRHVQLITTVLRCFFRFLRERGDISMDLVPCNIYSFG